MHNTYIEWNAELLWSLLQHMVLCVIHSKIAWHVNWVILAASCLFVVFLNHLMCFVIFEVLQCGVWVMREMTDVVNYLAVTMVTRWHVTMVTCWSHTNHACQVPVKHKPTLLHSKHHLPCLSVSLRCWGPYIKACGLYINHCCDFVASFTHRSGTISVEKVFWE